MEIIELKLDELIPYENNPRNNKAAVDYVAKSLKNFGWKQPIVVDKNNVIVCGHTRYLAAQKLKMKTAPCLRADDLTDEEIKAYRLVDNKTAEFAEWNQALLAAELAELPELDMTEYGFETVQAFEETEDELDEENEFDDIEKLDQHYGVPYQGNKSRIADIIISLLPAGERLVDLFGGGGCHYTLRNAFWKMEQLSV